MAVVAARFAHAVLVAAGVMFLNMPPPTIGSDKSRQSSGGKSFFGRKLHKDKSGDDASSISSSNLEPPGYPASTVGSRSSKHSKRASVGSLEAEDPSAGLNMTAGVITSIPFDSMPAETKTPISVNYLPKNEPNVRREPSPHHLAKGGGDFHQYPIWDPKATQNGQAHSNQVNGPRPPPHTSSLTMASSTSGDRGAKYQQWARPGSSATNTGFAHNSSSTGDSSAFSRNSIDQTSIYSTQSSMTRASVVSDHNSSRTMTPSNSAGDRNTSSSNNTNRYSNLQGSWLPGQPEPVTATIPSSGRASQASDQYLSRPKDDRVVDQLFFELMQKRGWQNLPEQAKRQMLAYPASKKWTLVHQDRLTELQGEQKRKQSARSTYLDQQSALMGRAEEDGSPEWYVKKVMDDSITSKQLASLSVSLRTQPIRYVAMFILFYLLRSNWID